MITIVTSFNRKENLPFMLGAIEKPHKEGKCNWTVLVNKDFVCDFPDWVVVKRYEKEFNDNIANRFLNRFISEGLEPETQYFTLNDDDSFEEGFFDKIPNADVVIVAMQRFDTPRKYIVWDNWDTKMGHYEYGIDVLQACKENLRVARVGGEQLIVKGKVWRNFRNGLQKDGTGDGVMICQIAQEYPITFVNDTHVLFNYADKTRWLSKPETSHRPQALFVGDWYRGASKESGLSEWEGGIWQSLESTHICDVARFHFDRYWWEVGQHKLGTASWWADTAFKAAFDDLKPDFVVIVMYKAPSGADPTVISLSSLEHIKQADVPIIAIWGDVESLEQQWLARSLEPWITKNISTASKEIAENMGYKYMHVPKNPKVFYSDDRVRDLDVVFSGSFGAGREDRQRAIKYLLDNGVKIIYGGSECGDHFPVMEYADRYRQAKIALSFSTACGKNVVNARSFEVMTCGAMLLEKEGDELKKLYTPNVDYVPWTDEVDLLNKVRYYLEHEDERKKIADSGHKKTIELYSAKTFWDSALKGIIK